MLAAYSMGSHGGQQNFPFGYLPDELHGIGLPNFMTPGPPPGQPLLNEHDNQTLNSFFNGFDAGGDAGKHGSMQQFGPEIGQGEGWMMPPTFVGSETSLRGRTGTEWQNFPAGDFAFGDDMNHNQIPQTMAYDNPQANFATNGQYDTNLLHQLHSAAHAAGGPSFGNSWHHQFPDQSVAQMPPKPIMRFGSDQHFQPGGYAAPDGQFEPTPNLDWLEAQSSANTTQPNTRPSTQPSSPVWTKKRKLDEFGEDLQRSGFASTIHDPNIRITTTHPNISRKGKKSAKRTDTPNSLPPTPVSGHPSNHTKTSDANTSDVADEDEDDEAGEELRSPSPAPWPANKPRPPKSNKQSSSKPARARRKSSSSNTPVKVKTKNSRSNAAATSRVPLTADQKKANHTNSEQRRRDATAKAYAELYDLVPELEDIGKQSTMKKLEIVVAKVTQVKERVEFLRSMLGVGGSNSVPQPTMSPYLTQAQGNIPAIFSNSAGQW